MQKRPDDPTIERTMARSRWLADLSTALDEAYRLAMLLASRNSDSREAIVLRTQIQAARAEVEALRRSAPSYGDRENDLNRIKLLPWNVTRRGTNP